MSKYATIFLIALVFYVGGCSLVVIYEETGNTNVSHDKSNVAASINEVDVGDDDDE